MASYKCNPPIDTPVFPDPAGKPPKKSSTTMKDVAPSSSEPATKKSTSKTSASKTPPRETIAMMVIKRKRDLENEFATKLDAKVTEVYDTAVKMVGEMPIDGVLQVTISSKPEFAVKIFNSKTEETIKWVSAECDNEHLYIKKASMVKLEKMLNTEGFHKDDSHQTDVVSYSISM